MTSTIDHLHAELASLVEWGREHGRQFPWRPMAGYPLAVAEILLQKTRGSAALPIWERLIEDYSDPESLAGAPTKDVVRLVEPLGLGKQRAARLQSMARAWGEDFSSVPGLGPYGAGILSLAAGSVATPPVDGNVARVISRVQGLSFERGEPRKKREVIDTVEVMLNATPADEQLNLAYALVDLGAGLCLPRKPKCAMCPLRPACAYFNTQGEAEAP